MPRDANTGWRSTASALLMRFLGYDMINVGGVWIKATPVRGRSAPNEPNYLFGQVQQAPSLSDVQPSAPQVAQFSTPKKKNHPNEPDAIQDWKIEVSPEEKMRRAELQQFQETYDKLRLGIDKLQGHYAFDQELPKTNDLLGRLEAAAAIVQAEIRSLRGNQGTNTITINGKEIELNTNFTVIEPIRFDIDIFKNENRLVAIPLEEQKWTKRYHAPEGYNPDARAERQQRVLSALSFDLAKFAEENVNDENEKQARAKANHASSLEAAKATYNAERVRFEKLSVKLRRMLQKRELIEEGRITDDQQPSDDARDLLSLRNPEIDNRVRERINPFFERAKKAWENQVRQINDGHNYLAGKNSMISALTAEAGAKVSHVFSRVRGHFLSFTELLVAKPTQEPVGAGNQGSAPLSSKGEKGPRIIIAFRPDKGDVAAPVPKGEQPRGFQ